MNHFCILLAVPDQGPNCCSEVTAKCSSCTAGMSIPPYGESNIGTAGCEEYPPLEPFIKQQNDNDHQQELLATENEVLPDSTESLGKFLYSTTN